MAFFFFSFIFFYFFFFFFSSRRRHTRLVGDWSSDVCSSDLVVFLELRRDSRVTTGNSGCLLCWPRKVQSSIRVAKGSWALLSSDCRANRPHLGLCPEDNVPLHSEEPLRTDSLLCMWPDWFSPPGAKWPKNATLTG